MSKSFNTSVYSLAQLVSVGLTNGASSDQITRVAVQQFKVTTWSAADKRQFRNKVAKLIAQARHKS